MAQFVLESGQNLWNLAKEHGFEFWDFVQAVEAENPGIDVDNIPSETTLKLPSDFDTKTLPILTNEKKPVSYNTYTNDTDGDISLATISQQLGINFNENADKYSLDAGKTATLRNDLQISQYTITSGDTGYGIARKFGIPFADLKKANPDLNWRNLQVGHKLELPQEVQVRAPKNDLSSTFKNDALSLNDKLTAHIGFLKEVGNLPHYKHLQTISASLGYAAGNTEAIAGAVEDILTKKGPSINRASLNKALDIQAIQVNSSPLVNLVKDKIQSLEIKEGLLTKLRPESPESYNQITKVLADVINSQQPQYGTAAPTEIGVLKP